MDKLVRVRLVERLRNRNFMLESKMGNPIKIKVQNNQIDQMLCENFNLPWG